MKLLDLNVAGEFIVVAATLMHIKSKMLLPPEEKTQEEELEELDPRAELVKRLLEYKKFKEAALLLREKEEHRKEHFVRLQKEVIDDEVYFEANLFDLISAFTKALKDIPKELFFEVIKDEFTVEEKIHDILHYFVSEPKIYLFDLFNRAKNKFEIIAIFLAILELIRLKEIIIFQKEIFGDIMIMRNKEKIRPHPSEQTSEQVKSQPINSSN
jgi:segregation and condensation protein A